MNKIVVGMSGGVDSSITLMLLKKAGWDPVGLSLKYCFWENPANPMSENVCCSSESFQLARQVCEKFSVPYHIWDVSQEFQTQVIDYYVEELKNGFTPNPCMICNPKLKFKLLLKWAELQGITRAATGHYAVIEQDPQSGELRMLSSQDREKDQTYYLSGLPYPWLENLVFPLGKYRKSQVLQLALENGFEIYLKRKQSQDFCFVSGKALKDFYRSILGENPGPIKNLQNQVLGEHLGLHFYTLGQRKGIGLSGGPYFTVRKTASDNTLWVSTREEDLTCREVLLDSCNFLSPQPPKTPLEVKARLRYRQELTPAVLSRNEAGLKLTFHQPQKAATPGQFGVFYQDEVCLGGGRIVETR